MCNVAIKKKFYYLGNKMRLYLISFVGFVIFTGLYRQVLCINLLSERQIKELYSLTSFYFI